MKRGIGRLPGCLAAVIGVTLTLAACSSDAPVDDEPAETTSETTAPVEDTTGAEEVDDVPVDAAATPPEDAGPDANVLVMAHDREPADLHLTDPGNGPDRSTISWLRAPLLESLFGVDATLTHYPQLLAAEPIVTLQEDETVVIDFRLRQGLQWSDGTPLTSADVKYTLDIINEGCQIEADDSIADNTNDGCIFLMGSRAGYDRIVEFREVNSTEFQITFANFYAGWRDLFGDVQILAAHAFGVDAAQVNRNLRNWRGSGGVLPSSGPLLFESWDRGRTMSFVRNDEYHGSASPDASNDGPAQLDGVVVWFLPRLEDRIEALSTGTAHVMMGPAEIELLPLTTEPGFTVAASPGASYEHWGLNLLNPHLAKPEVRRAIAQVIDKAALVEELYTPLFGPEVAADGLGNAYWMANQGPYEDHQTPFAGNDLGAAAASLEAAGYTRLGNGFYRHPLDGRLTLRVGTTGGNGFRLVQQQILQSQFEDSGIEIVIDNLDGGSFFTDGPFSQAALAASATSGVEGDGTVWDIAQFSWQGGPWPGGASGPFRSGSATNIYGFNNPEFDIRANECDDLANDAARAACYNELSRFVTTLDIGPDGLFIIPLSQKPAFFGYRSDVLASVGVAPDAEGEGPLANVVDYRFAP